MAHACPEFLRKAPAHSIRTFAEQLFASSDEIKINCGFLTTIFNSKIYYFISAIFFRSDRVDKTD